MESFKVVAGINCVKLENGVITRAYTSDVIVHDKNMALDAARDIAQMLKEKLAARDITFAEHKEGTYASCIYSSRILNPGHREDRQDDVELAFVLVFQYKDELDAQRLEKMVRHLSMVAMAEVINFNI